MRDIVIALTIAVIVSLVCGPVLIPFLRRLKFGQQIRSDGPRSHQKKSGTPTMGGLMFFISVPLATFAVTGYNSRVLMVLLVSLGFGLIGFFDDFIKIVMKRPLGLRAREKILGQFLLSAVFVYAAVYYAGRGTAVFFPVIPSVFDIGWLYFPLGIFVMISSVNAVNLTDGLDGLASGITIFAAVTYMLLCQAWGLTDLSVFAAALVGGCLGFLIFNLHPARIFMGDTGSLALGGALGALAVLTKTELLLPLLGGVFVLETLSVIIQVLYFRLNNGKRFFKMAPLHHHFELSGWSEQKVVFSFWTMAAAFAILSIVIAL